MRKLHQFHPAALGLLPPLWGSVEQPKRLRARLTPTINYDDNVVVAMPNIWVSQEVFEDYLDDSDSIADAKEKIQNTVRREAPNE